MMRTLVPSTAPMVLLLLSVGMVFSGLASVPSAHAITPFNFSSGSPDGLIGMASRPQSPGVVEIEAADDFIATGDTTVNHATFIGLLPSGASLLDVTQLNVEMYRVFPLDSVNPPSGNAPTRVNSPSDFAFESRSSAVVGDLAFTATILAISFTVANTVVNGINKVPNQFTGGEGPATGEEVSFDVTLINPFTLPHDHYFFVPQVELASGNFLWLSAPRPIVGGTGPFTPDLQAWIRDGNLAPDWLRVGTDITHQGPFNGVFSLSGTSTSAAGVPEFPLPAILVGAIALAVVAGLRRFGSTPNFP